jgi:hypothetical protein
MKNLSMFLCFAMSVILVVIIFNNGWPKDIWTSLMLIGFFASQAIILYTLDNCHNSDGSESWLSLFLQRKKLEEKAKVEKLKIR